MQNTVAMFKEFFNEDQGATAIEYGLLVALISLLIVSGASLVGTNLAAVFTRISECLQAPTSTACTLVKV